MSRKDKTITDYIQEGLRIIKPNLPAKEKPFQDIPLSERAIFILHLAGFSYRQIKQIFASSKPTIYRISQVILGGYRRYPSIKRP